MQDGMPGGPVRHTRFGPVRGLIGRDRRVMFWKGIPFAAPPVGARRWRAPVDPQPWSDPLDARSECLPCAQLAYAPTWIRSPAVLGSEDCLYLSVYRPASTEDMLPVYVWIHGGANNSGYAAEYDLSRFADATRSLVVVPQYRLNVFGFFSHPALREGRSAADASGNFGCLDLIKALEWVRDNADGFGGDPHNVTIAGESAGAHNISALLICPLARGLFQRAIMQSGFMRWDSRAQADAIAERTVAAALSLKGRAPGDSPADLRNFLQSLSTEELVQSHAGGPGQTALPLGNLIEDGHVVPENLLRAFAAGRYARVPILLGTNARETGLTSPMLPPLYPGMPDYRQLNEVSDGRRPLSTVLRSPRERSLYEKANAYGSLFWRTAHTDEFSRALAQHQDVYAYLFQWGDEVTRPGDLGFIYGAAHAIEIPFFHGNVADGPPSCAPWAIYNGMTPANRAGRIALSEAIVSYIAEFLRNGTPNRVGSLQPRWRPWSNRPGESKYLALGADTDRALIGMQTDENFKDAIWARLNAEPEEDQRHILAVIGAVQGFYVKPPASPMERG